jgi:HEPN domain-containing protein
MLLGEILMSRQSLHAQDFLNAYKILKDSNKALIEKNEGREQNEYGQAAYGKLPAMGIDIVCLAFSVELHLKELHRVVTGATPRGHNIVKLFRDLPDTVQKEVAAHQSITHYGWSDEQLDLELHSISDGFEKWRYAYESTSLRYNSYFAEVLIEASRFVASAKIRGV